MDEISNTTPTADSSLEQNVSPAPPTMLASDPTVRFRGLGTNFRAKLIGMDDVPDSRGDKMCQESILKLKAAARASGRHKQKIIVNVSLEGIKIVDVLTGEVQHVHPVHRISFIARDLTDRRAFGYVYGAGEGRHQFFGIKTAKAAEILVLALRDLFQVVYNMTKKEIEEAKVENMVNGNEDEPQAPVPAPRQQQIQNEAVYTVPGKQKQEGNLFDLEQQLTTIQEGINNIDAIGPWPQDLPTSPDSTAGDLTSGDLFGIANLSDISSLSSDFSCASNTIIDAGGGNQQFERTGSSRSSASFQGIELNRALSRSSIHGSASGGRLLAVPDESSNCKPVQQKRAGNEEPRQTVTKDTVLINRTTEVNVNIAKKVQIEGKENSEAKSEKRTGASSAAENDVPTGSLKESSSLRSLPGSDKVSRRRGSSFFSRGKRSTKKPKSKKEKGGDNKKIRGDKPQHYRTASESKRAEDVVKPRSVSTPLSELQRRESVSSINSVRSCIIPTTVYNTESVQKSASRTSLDVVSSKVSENQGEDGKFQRPLTTDSFIVRSSICPRTRPRPKNYETPSSSNIQDDEQKNVSEPVNSANQLSENDTAYSDNKQSSPAGSPAWVASFDADFTHLSGSKEIKLTGNDIIDPFTGLATNELQPTLTPAFEDVPWSPSDSTEAAGNATPLPQPFGEDFSADPFSSPFDGVDPFASTQMDDPFAETLETFEDPFANENANSDETVFEVVEQQQDVSETPETSNINIPTFPAKSEDIMFTLKELKSNSAEESSMTSGMSTPMGTQSPEHSSIGTTKNDVDFAAPCTKVPPVIPPRLPPRPAKKSPILDVSPMSECPNVPPPPLPESLPEPLCDEDFEEEDILGEDDEYSSSPIMELPPPEIPQRAYTSLENSDENETSDKGVIQVLLAWDECLSYITVLNVFCLL